VKKGDHLEDLVIDGKIILNFNLKKWGGKAWTGFTWLRRGQMVSCCEQAINFHVLQNTENCLPS